MRDALHKIHSSQRVAHALGGLHLGVGGGGSNLYGLAHGNALQPKQANNLLDQIHLALNVHALRGHGAFNQVALQLWAKPKRLQRVQHLLIGNIRAQNLAATIAAHAHFLQRGNRRAGLDHAVAQCPTSCLHD